jgi:hypothetical protein
MTRHLTDLDRGSVDWVLYRYGHLYIVQDRELLVLDPDGGSHRTLLEFTPTTWAAYGGQLTLYDRYAGIAVFSGHRLLAESHQVGFKYTAPYAMPLADGQPLLGAPEQLRGVDGEEVNGLLVSHSNMPGMWHLPVQGQDVPAPITAASLELGHWITFHKDKRLFTHYNGTRGRLMFGDPPERIVPYLYAGQGLLAAGTPNGYLLSPDLGLSWRQRSLSGWGALTERAILQVSPDRGVEIIEGWW